MDNNYLNNESFSFDSFSDNDTLNYGNISGLGESDYENEDLFPTEIKENISNRVNNDYVGEPFETSFENVNEYAVHKAIQTNNYNVEENNQEENTQFNLGTSLEKPEEYVATDLNQTFENDMEQAPTLQDENQQTLEQESNTEENDADTLVEEKKNILTETPIEELQKLTEYTEEKINSTDIKSLFDKVGVNVQEASDIFKKNTEMKEKIDSRFEELKKLQSEIEKTKKNQFDEINAYKEEVLSKLTEKKEEIEKRLNKLKENQANLEKEKAEFEQYRKTEKEEIARVQKEVQEAYDSRREELSHIEDVLRKQKDSLDEERSKLSLDVIQYESDKNELANNLLKFNEIVASFTDGMERIGKE